MYYMVSTRLDLAATIGVVQFFNNFGFPNWQVIKQYLDICKVFRILHYKILQIPSRKIMVYNCMVFVTWTREGMLILDMAPIQAMKDAIWLRRFLGEVGYKQEKPILIFIDSQRSLTLLKNLVHHSHTKHINI